jgi:hypothetical protein
MTGGSEFGLGMLLGALVVILIFGGLGLVPNKGRARLDAEHNAAMCEHYLTDHATTELDSLRIITTMPNCVEADDEQ